MKSPRSPSTPKGTRSSLLAVTRLAVYGLLIQEMRFKSLKAMRMKYSLALSITKVTQSLQVPRITPAEFGRTRLQ
jgi:hypothetical protein